MSAAKEQYLRNAETVKSALAITHSDTFQNLLIFANAEFAAKNPTTDELRGANEFQRTLMGLPEKEVELVEIPGIGLTHDLSKVEIKRSQPKTKEA